MTTMWGIHNDHFGYELVDDGFVSIGWEGVGDVGGIGNDPARLRAAVAAANPTAKPGAIPVWAGVLRRFAYEMQIGDHVVAPRKVDSTLNFGVVEGPYEYHPEVSAHPHRRRVRWLKTGISRSLFPRSALYEVSAWITLFQIRRSIEVFDAFLAAPTDSQLPGEIATAGADAGHSDPRTEALQDEPNADRIDQHTRDFITRVLLTRLSTYEFEHFVAALLRAMGYEARVTPRGGDGGIDVIAHRDPLGLEPPIIKVQCKQTNAAVGRPVVQQLIGALAHNELGLCATLGSYTREALDEERQRQNLRLLGGADLAELTLRHYADLAPEWRLRMPLRQVLVVDHDPDLS